MLVTIGRGRTGIFLYKTPKGIKMKFVLFPERVKLFLIPLAAAFIGGVIVLVGQTVLFDHTPTQSTAEGTPDTPGMEFIDAYSCERAENKIVMFRGKEDNFSYEGDEAANINPQLLESPYYRDLVGGNNRVHSHRDYDERGVDKILLDHFKLPADITGGMFVFRASAEGNTETDTIGFYDFHKAQVKNASTTILGFGMMYENALADYLIENTSDILAIPIEAMKGRSLDKKHHNLASYLNANDRSQTLDLMIQDDIMLDFAALILCQTPQVNKGATFIEIASKWYGPGVSYMGCNVNKTQPMCDPIIGDQLCSVPTPLACYRDGEGRPPDIKGFPKGTFLGGEIRQTKPVRGDQFQTYTETVKFCQSEFGEDWRVLSYHEAGGGAVASLSDIQINTRMWIDVIDQPYATCWSRK